MDIFSYIDIDGDLLRIGPAPEDWDDAHDGCLAFTVTQRGQDHSVALPPSVVDELIGALDRWRSGVVTARETSAPPASLEPIYDAIVQRLTDEWLPRVLPLHQAPKAATWAPTVFPATSCHRSGNHGPESLCSDCTVDPEPHDVGHAEAPAKPHPTDWSDKLFGKPTYDAEPEHGRLMSELPRRVKSLASLYCDGCKHLWSDHGRFNIRGCHAPGEDDRNCECSRVMPRG